jgi:hypothetical protein
MRRPRVGDLLVAALLLEISSVGASAAVPCSAKLPLRGQAADRPAPKRVRAACEPSRLGPSNVPVPTIEGPVTGGNGYPYVSATGFDLAEVGYSQAEFFLSGTASSFTNLGTFDSDGRWRAVPASGTSYKTRIVVYRPIDAARFNGTVVVEWLNVSGGLDAAPDWTSAHTELIREGFVWVGVSAQSVGVEGSSGMTLVSLPLKKVDPERYGSLHHPGDSFSYDMFSQAGQAVRHPGAVDPLGGLTPRRVIAAGESQSAFRLVTYVNAVHPLAQVYDGFLVHSRGSSGAPLSQSPQPAIAVPSPARFRTDLGVPVLVFETETDLVSLGYFPDRQADGSLFRLWEVAGTAHADTYTLLVGATDLGNSPSAADLVVTASPIPGIIDCDKPINSGPQHFVLNAAFAAFNRWVRDGTPPPHAPRLQITAGTPPVIALDSHGNALGGIRTPAVDAPIATLSGLGQTGANFCRIFGTTVPFDRATLAALYPSHDAYVAAVEAAADRAVNAGFILEPDAELIKASAAASDIGN